MRIGRTWIDMDEERARVIKRLVRGRKGRLLDIGCWKDYEHFKDLNCEFYGLDKVKACEMPHFIKQDLDKNPKLPFKDNFFDIVFAFEVLEHLEFPEKVIEEIKRVIKPDGIILISLPNDYTWDMRIKFLLGKDPFLHFDENGDISEFRHKTIFKASTAKKWLEKFFPINEIFHLGRFVGERFLPFELRNLLAKIYPNLFCRVQIFRIEASDFK
jgi:SAM-dependent methyltransferase